MQSVKKEQKMDKYNRAKSLRQQSLKDIKAILPKLEKLHIELEEFYNLMRWSKLNCSEVEYSELYDGLVYPYEEEDVHGLLEELIIALRKLGV